MIFFNYLTFLFCSRCIFFLVCITDTSNGQFGECFLLLQFRRLALKSPPLGPKWARWAKKLWCASDPPVCSLLVWEDRMRTQVFSPTYPTWALVGGTSRPAGETVIPVIICASPQPPPSCGTAPGPPSTPRTTPASPWRGTRTGAAWWRSTGDLATDCVV